MPAVNYHLMLLIRIFLLCHPILRHLVGASQVVNDTIQESLELLIVLSQGCDQILRRVNPHKREESFEGLLPFPFTPGVFTLLNVLYARDLDLIILVKVCHLYQTAHYVEQILTYHVLSFQLFRELIVLFVKLFDLLIHG